MNTPAHIAASLLVWRKQPGWKSTAAIAFGAALPDLPMFGFYIYQKVVGSTEREIWSELYFTDDWQLLFDIFNSIPVAILAMAILVRLNRPILWLVAASALLHLLCDLPVHHDDAHRHFLPFTNWRFRSPISYWDPRFFGRQFAAIELLFAIGTSLYLLLRGEHVPMRIAGGVNLALYFFGLMLLGILWLQLTA